MFDYRNRADLRTGDLKNRYGNRAWLVPVVILLAALAASLTIGELHHKAQDKNDAQLLLAVLRRMPPSSNSSKTKL